MAEVKEESWKKELSSVEQPAIRPSPRVTHTPVPGRQLRINPRREFPTRFLPRKCARRQDPIVMNE